MASSPRRRWGAPASPLAASVHVTVVSPAGSPQATWAGSPDSDGTSPSSPHIFSLSPEVVAPAGLGPSSKARCSPGSYSDTFGSEARTDDDGDNLTSFLADLKSKYGLVAPPPPSFGIPAAAARTSPVRRHLFQAPPAACALQHALQAPAPTAPSQVSVRVVVQQGGHDDGGSGSSASEVLSAEGSQQLLQPGKQHAVAAIRSPPRHQQRPLGAEQHHWPGPPDTSWMNESDLPPAAPALASLITNPMFDNTAAGRAMQAEVHAGRQQTPSSRTAEQQVQSLAAQQAAQQAGLQAARQAVQLAAQQTAMHAAQQAAQAAPAAQLEALQREAAEFAAQQAARAAPAAQLEAEHAAREALQREAAEFAAQQAAHAAPAAQLGAERAGREALQREAAEFAAQQAASEAAAAVKRDATAGTVAATKAAAAAAAAVASQPEIDVSADQLEDEVAAVAQGTDPTSRDWADEAQWAVPSARQRRRLPWGTLHTLLVQRGFPGIFASLADSGAAAVADYADLEPANEDLFEALHSLLEEQARAAAHARRLTEALQAAQRREGALVAGFTSAAKRREAEVAKWKRLALDNQVAVRDAQLSSQQSGRASDAAAVEARRLECLVQQLEHQLRGKDVELQRQRQLLGSQQERDERRSAADKQALDRLKRAYAASKAADTNAGAAATVKAAAKEMKPVDICRVFEAERANLAEAAAAAAADAASARAALKQAQEAMHAAGLPCEQFDEIEGQARLAARQAAAADERAVQLTEEASLLRLELAARPTQAQYDSLKRQADIMERQLAKAAADKAAAEQEQQKGDNTLQRQLQRQVSTREMIQRDRNMQRLGLHTVEELPKPVLVEVLQDACALLECRQPLELCAALKPVQDLAALVPRMERFIGDVCGAVFQRGLAHVPEVLRQDNPSDIPAILATWIAELGELVEMRGLLRVLLRQLASRVSIQPADPAPTAAEVVPLVASLVELERQVYQSREVIQAAETALVAQPEVLMNRICLQFQRLFDCRSLEGLLPAMNKLYLAHTEAQTFLASLRAALGLDPAATLEACANRLEQLLADRCGALSAMLPARETHAAAPALPPSAAAVVVEVPRQRSRDAELQQAAQVAVERMAARRNWPQVQIFVPSAAGPEGVQGV